MSYNHLDLLKAREVPFIPPHFFKLTFRSKDNDLMYIKKWVQSRLKGRFFLSQIPAIMSRITMTHDAVIAFELEDELTFFLIACPYIIKE